MSDDRRFIPGADQNGVPMVDRGLVELVPPQQRYDQVENLVGVADGEQQSDDPLYLLHKVHKRTPSLLYVIS